VPATPAGSIMSTFLERQTSMRRLIGAGLACLFALSIATAIGCSDNKKKTEIPDKQVDPPKIDPTPAGGGKGGKQVGTGAPPSSAQ
jgi:hypothetical protein